MPLESMDVDSVLKTKKCIAIDTNKLIFVIGIRSKGRLNSYFLFNLKPQFQSPEILITQINLLHQSLNHPKTATLSEHEQIPARIFRRH